VAVEVVAGVVQVAVGEVVVAVQGGLQGLVVVQVAVPVWVV